MIVFGKYVVLANEADWNANYDNIQEDNTKPEKFPALFEQRIYMDWRGWDKYHYHVTDDVQGAFDSLKTMISNLQKKQQELKQLYETN